MNTAGDQSEKLVAQDLLGLLAKRHSNDVFVPECKDGPTQGTGGHFRLDAWVMASSWATPTVWGYEIKVSRSDFLADAKWPAYLPMCNQLFFVCPWGLIQPEEMPAEVGLLWASKNGSRLYNKAKAAHREVEIPETVWRYILMCRAKIRSDEVPLNQPTREFWQQWLRDQKLDRDFGWRVAKTLAKRVHEDIVSVREDNERLVQLLENYSNIRKFLKAKDIDPDNEYQTSKRHVEEQLKRAQQALPQNLGYTLDRAINGLESAKKELESIINE